MTIMRLVLACFLLLPSVALLAQPSVDLTFIREFGGLGDGPGQFNLPHAIDIDRKGRLIIADGWNRRVQICSQEGDCHVLGSDGAGAVDFVNPWGVVADNHGQILVTDDRLRICSYRGDCDTEFMLNGPGVDVDGQGHIAVAERFSEGVHICDYDADCSIIGELDFSAENLSPPGIWATPNAVAFDKRGRVWVGEFHHVHQCSISGECTKKWEGVPRFGELSGLEVDNRGHFFIADGGADKVRVCHEDGTCTSFGDRRGDAPGEFSRPTDLALADDGKLFVADRANHRIQVFQVAFDESDFHINPGLSDAWYDPATAGQGVAISVFPDIKQMFLAWFTYDTERPPDDVNAYLREPGHRWLTAQGPYDVNTANLTIYLTEGGVFDEATPVPITDQEGIGSMTITFSNCNSGLMTYNISSPVLSGEMPLQRVATDNVAACETMEDL